MFNVLRGGKKDETPHQQTATQTNHSGQIPLGEISTRFEACPGH